MRNALAVVAVLGLLTTAGFILADADAATKTLSRTYDDTTVKDNNGSYLVLPDAGYRVTCCGVATLTDGGSMALDSPCVTVESGALSTTYTVCKAAWSSANL